MMPTRALAIAVLASASACGLFGPDGGRSFRIQLPFCGPFATPVTWAAVKKAGADWAYLTETNGSASFDASGSVTVAYGTPLGTRVFSATAEELSQVACFPSTTATKLNEGSVRDVPPDERFTLTFGPITLIETPFAAFIPSGPAELVARTEKIATGIPSRVIVRHGVNLPSGAEIPVVDFSTNEARPFVSALATINHSGTGAFNNVFWPWGNSHFLRSGGVDQAPLQYFAVPEALLAPDDYHTLNVRDFIANAPRDLTFFYRKARAVTLTMGAPANLPVGTLLTPSPCARMQARVASQTEYPSFVVATFYVSPGQSDQSVIEVGVTRAFLGDTPATWTVEIPDLRSSAGTCLASPFPGSWSVTVAPHEGRFALYLGGRGRDGEILRSSFGDWSSP